MRIFFFNYKNHTSQKPLSTGKLPKMQLSQKNKDDLFPTRIYEGFILH